MQTISRRTLLAGMAALPVLAADEKIPAPKQKVAIFSKHLSFVKGDALAQAAADCGFDGVDLTVRKGGHVEPERVRQDLPPLVATIKRHGLDVPMITTDISDDATPFAEDILKTMAELNVRRYRWNGFKYETGRAFAAQLDALKPRIARLAALNARYQATAMYHTHSGAGVVGAPIWDLYILLKDFDPSQVAVNYDVAHAVIEGGLGGWIDSFNITAPHLRGIAVKDFVWAKDARGEWKNQWKPIGEGMVRFPQFFKMVSDAHFDGPLQIHFEYPLKTPEETYAAMKRDLRQLRAYLTQAGL
jgi:sugar phosphate isomerase/epimerase